jgi:hypothetical protein
MAIDSGLVMRASLSGKYRTLLQPVVAFFQLVRQRTRFCDADVSLAERYRTNVRRGNAEDQAGEDTRKAHELWAEAAPRINCKVSLENVSAFFQESEF